eukprot:gene61-77_t
MPLRRPPGAFSIDHRAAKANGMKKPSFPDFKHANDRNHGGLYLGSRKNPADLGDLDARVQGLDFAAEGGGAGNNSYNSYGNNQNNSSSFRDGSDNSTGGSTSSTNTASSGGGGSSGSAPSDGPAPASFAHAGNEGSK